ncbi:MAG TPA: DUF6263 family protein [Blastocatellia bacterium]|nr:DUF6263 family protein [Blastocatellia bacterium]
MIRRVSIALMMILACSALTAAQGEVSLRPIFKSGDENRYTISAIVDTNVTPSGSPGLRGSSRRELNATVLIRTVSVSETGEADLEALVEALSFNSTSNIGGSQPPINNHASGKTIRLKLSPTGLLSKCTVPQSQAYQILLDFILSLARWYPTGEIAVGESWQSDGHGPLYSAELSPISKRSTTLYKLASVEKGTASIEGAVTLSSNGTSAVNPGASAADVGMIGSGRGTVHFEVDLATGRVLNAITESQIEGNIANTQPSDGVKPEHRTGSLVEIAKFSIKLVK